MPTIVTRFHGTKTLDPMRAVRDISQISDEILALFTVNGVPIKITVDIESSAVEKLSADEVAALKENLNHWDSANEILNEIGSSDRSVGVISGGLGQHAVLA